MQYKNKVAIITGGSRGIGAALANALVQKECRVVIGDVLDKEGNEVVEKLNKAKGKKMAVYIHCNVTELEDNKALFEITEKEFGGIDIVVLNAGIIERNPTLMSDSELETFRIIEVNIGGVIKGTQLAIAHLQKRGGGVIINTASMAGLFGFPMAPIYVASKHAVIGFTRSLDILSKINIRVNAVCPFWVDTDILRNPRKSNRIFDQMMQYERHTAMNTCIQAYLDFIEDERYHGDVIMSLPDGNQLVPKPTLPPSAVSNAPSDVRKNHWQSVLDHYKRVQERDNKL